VVRSNEKNISGVKQLTRHSSRRHHVPAVLGCGRGVAWWRNTVPRTDLWRTNAPRVELDSRSREARLQLERARRLIALPAQSWLSRMRYRFGLRLFGAGRAERRSAGARNGETRDITTGFGLVASGLPAAVLIALTGTAA
jgi:hypothetical protein